MSRISRPSFSQTPTKSLAFVAGFALLVSTTPLVSAEGDQPRLGNWPSSSSPSQRQEPRPGPPDGVFPNMDEMRRMTDDRRRYGVGEPTTPAPIPSTRRRWRRGSQAAQPSSNVKVDLSALIAFASPRSDTGIPWLTSRESESISTAPIGLSFSSNKDFAPDHKASAETAGIAASVALSPQSPSNFAMARLAPQNRAGSPGVDLLSKNFNWNLGLIGLRGRSGLDLGLNLAYNSRVWTKTGNYITLGLYDIHYDPKEVNINGGSSRSLRTVIEEIAHTVQFIQVWEKQTMDHAKMGEFGIDTTSYDVAMDKWATHYAYYSIKGLGYDNEVERWAQGKVKEVMEKLIQNAGPKQSKICGFDLYP